MWSLTNRISQFSLQAHRYTAPGMFATTARNCASLSSSSGRSSPASAGPAAPASRAGTGASTSGEGAASTPSVEVPRAILARARDTRY
jgi:hypothetical protein